MQDSDIFEVRMLMAVSFFSSLHSDWRLSTIENSGKIPISSHSCVCLTHLNTATLKSSCCLTKLSEHDIFFLCCHLFIFSLLMHEEAYKVCLNSSVELRPCFMFFVWCWHVSFQFCLLFLDQCPQSCCKCIGFFDTHESATAIFAHHHSFAWNELPSHQDVWIFFSLFRSSFAAETFRHVCWMRNNACGWCFCTACGFPVVCCWQQPLNILLFY